MLNGYVTNLGKYTEGELVGEWVAFPITEEELEKVLNRIGINEQYEEYFFTDWETDFNDDLGEYVQIGDINDLAERYLDLDKHDQEAVKALMEYGHKLEEALDDVDNVTFYEGYSLLDVAYELVEDMNLPEFALTYFDYEAFTRDLGCDGYQEMDNGVICW